MGPNIEAISSPVILGEGPFWDEETQMLYFVDITSHSLHSYNAKTNKYNSVNVGKLNISIVIIMTYFVIFYTDCFRPLSHNFL